MKEGFRQCMAWLHTWTGLVVGWILFFVFLTGTAGYVQIELSRWMQPERPLQQQVFPNSTEQFSKAYAFLKNDIEAAKAERWGMSFISEQRGADALTVNWSLPAAEGERYGKYQRTSLNPTTGLPTEGQEKPRETSGGHTLYRMHYALHYIPYDWAIRIIGICTMLMFVAMISGVITHKKIFKDFFTFRPAKGQRSWLDGHVILSVIALPFHLMITYSGLVFFLNAYMPLGVPLAYGEAEKSIDHFYAELYNSPIASNDTDNAKTMALGDESKHFADFMPMLQQVQQQWGPGQIEGLSIYPSQGVEPARAEFYKYSSHVARSYTTMNFNLLSGKEIVKGKTPQDTAPLIFGSTILGLHVGSFASPLVRLFYVITGLIGTAMVATGLVLWTVKRRPKQMKAGKMLFGHGLVERLNIAMVAGLPLAIAVYFWANRLLSVGFEGRAAWEVHCLYLSLLFSLLYALCRPIPRAWFELLALAAVAYLSLPILNVLTTDRHLGVTLLAQDYVLASIDIGFFMFGLLLAWAAYAVWRKRLSILKPVVKAKRVVKQQSVPKASVIVQPKPVDPTAKVSSDLALDSDSAIQSDSHLASDASKDHPTEDEP